MIESFPLDLLRRHVVPGAADRTSREKREKNSPGFPGQRKIDQLDPCRLVNEHILRLHVGMDNVLGVEVVKRATQSAVMGRMELFTLWSSLFKRKTKTS